MLLAIDIGNTHVVAGIFEEKKLLSNWRFSSIASRTEDECWGLLYALAQTDNVEIKNIKGCIISSVVPNLTLIFRNMVSNRLGLKAIIVNASLPLGITIHYESPNTVGADRICNAIAGFKKYGGPLIIVDFGTATTFDVISKDGDYLGGIIAPGVETSLQTLHYRAALLQKVELKFPEKVVGRNTETSMQSGLMYGTAELVNGLLQRLKTELQGDFTVIATGGLAALITPKLNSSLYLEPHLTLYGLQIIYDKVT